MNQNAKPRSEAAGQAPSPTIAPVEPPYAPELAEAFNEIMPAGVAPLMLFRVLARNPRIFQKIRAGSLLDRGSLTLREREIIIDRTTARCGAEYEWGVHVGFFAERVGLTREQVRATVHGSAQDPAWSPHERLLIEMVDALHDTTTLTPALLGALRRHWSDEQILEMLWLVGFYHGISFIANAAALPREDWAPRFPEP